MTTDEIRLRIEQDTGIPASLLTGETAEENIAQAKTLLAYTKTGEQDNGKQFEAWMQNQLGIEVPDPRDQALASIEESTLSSLYYPDTGDGGEIDLGDGRDTRDQFAEWMGQQLAWDPKVNRDGWKHLG